MKLWIAAFLWAAAVGISVPAVAQTPEQLADARRIFAEGIELGAQGHWDSATEKFRQVMEIRPAPAVSYNLAVALEHLGHYLEADDVLGPVLEDPTAPANVRRNSQELAARVRAQLGRLTIVVSGGSGELQVLVDDQPVPPAQLDRFRVDPGTRIVALVRGGMTVTSQTIEVAPGATETVTLDAAEHAVPLPSQVQPAPAPVAEPVLPPTEEPDRGGGGVLSQWWFWTIVGVVAVGAVTATVVVAQPSDPVPVMGNLGLFNVRPLSP